MRFRGKSIRRKMVALLMVPLVSLMSIWVFATYITASDAKRLLDVVEIDEKVGSPSELALHSVERERRYTLVYLADPRLSDVEQKMLAARKSTDKAIRRVRDNAESDGLRPRLQEDSRELLDKQLSRYEDIVQARVKADAGTLTRPSAYQQYNAVADATFDFLASLDGFTDQGLVQHARALVEVARAREYLARENALLSAAFADRVLTKADHRAIADRISERSYIYDTVFQSLPPEEGRVYSEFWNSGDAHTLRSYEDAIVDHGPGRANAAVNAKRWEATSSTVLSDLEEMTHQAYDRFRERAEPEGRNVFLIAGGATVLGFLAVLLSVIISLRIGRSLVRDLNTLRKEANESAGVRLPSVMRRLGAGEEVDVETEAPRLDYGPDEMGQVGQALNTLQRAAVEAAVKQAEMRRGVSEVFVNLARRSQVLLHRQLTLLDTMERRTENPDELADLFALDHLTTRMRRHAEGLVILSGAAPSRQWRKPVQLMDVVRAAVSEVEDYERIEVRRLPRLAVDGPAVGDLTHLIAELLENATVFSPPHTAVQVLGERVANGYLLEIHDRGLGMPPEMLLDANLRLAETSEFELSDTDRLGLFVVSRLANRQGVRVSLQPSPYGGTTAVVLIPGTLLTETPGIEGDSRSDVLEAGETPPGPRALLSGRSGRTRAARPSTPHGGLDGPVELEPPREANDPAPREDSLFRPSPEHPPLPARGPQRAQHEVEQPPTPPGHQGPAPLPRRRPHRSPTLVSDHGRPVEPERDGSQETRERERSEEAPRRPQQVPSPRPYVVPTPTREESSDSREENRPAEPPTTGGTVGGLPRRVRQASLAPQLRTEGPPSPRTSGEEQRADERDAEEVRDRMAALQRGWQRGRQHNASPREDTSRNPGTTPEGNGP
ncbi:nitrate- and nitrite sensing domain-containing protein [Streptomyces sp. NPDC005438]|uniref:nitrate- and nitrite sensing domain-containing protein n=1 Tax=Streptomyces sp. NPDC005438 TaxID=3156880 RepID=UPI0033AFE26C